MMLKAILYGYMNNIYSCRKIEEALKRDIHFIWLAGYEQPDFNTINRFRNRVKNENEGRRDDERTDKTGLQPANRDREPVYP